MIDKHTRSPVQRSRIATNLHAGQDFDTIEIGKILFPQKAKKSISPEIKETKPFFKNAQEKTSILFEDLFENKFKTEEIHIEEKQPEKPFIRNILKTKSVPRNIQVFVQSPTKKKRGRRTPLFIENMYETMMKSIESGSEYYKNCKAAEGFEVKSPRQKRKENRRKEMLRKLALEKERVERLKIKKMKKIQKQKKKENFEKDKKTVPDPESKRILDSLNAFTRTPVVQVNYIKKTETLGIPILSPIKVRHHRKFKEIETIKGVKLQKIRKISKDSDLKQLISRQLIEKKPATPISPKKGEMVTTFNVYKSLDPISKSLPNSPINTKRRNFFARNPFVFGIKSINKRNQKMIKKSIFQFENAVRILQLNPEIVDNDLKFISSIFGYRGLAHEKHSKLLNESKEITKKRIAKKEQHLKTGKGIGGHNLEEEERIRLGKIIKKKKENLIKKTKDFKESIRRSIEDFRQAIAYLENYIEKQKGKTDETKEEKEEKEKEIMMLQTDISSYYCNIGVNFLAVDNLEEGKKAFTKAINLSCLYCSQEKNDAQLCNFYGQRARCLERMKDFESAVKDYFESANTCFNNEEKINTLKRINLLNAIMKTKKKNED